MATVIHRRPASPSPYAAPRGPGASLSALTWVGWASLLAVVASLAWQLRPILEMGNAEQWSWAEIARRALYGLPEAATLALPAAVEWGIPGARRRAPVLVRGVVLLAVAQALRRLETEAQFAAFSAAMDSATFGELGDPWSSPLVLAVALIGLTAGLVALAGAWFLSGGLAEAGARLERRVVIGTVVASLAGSGLVIPMLLAGEPLGVGAALLARVAMGLAGSIASMVAQAIWLVIAVRLFAGARAGIRPRRGWIVGALAGTLIVAGRVVFFAWLVPIDQVPAVLTTVVVLLGSTSEVVLAAAFLAGLGRGRVRREAFPARVRVHQLGTPDGPRIRVARRR